MDDLVCLFSTLIRIRSDLPVIISLVQGNEDVNSRCASSLYSIITYILGQQTVLCTLFHEQVEGAVQNHRSSRSAAQLALPIPGIVAIAISCSSAAFGEQAMQEGRRASLDQCRLLTPSSLPSYVPLIDAWCPQAVPLLVCIFRPKRAGGVACGRVTSPGRGAAAELNKAVLRWYSSGARGIGSCCADVIHQVRDVLLSDEEGRTGRQCSPSQATTHRSSSL
jgi:hypothetical protein